MWLVGRCTVVLAVWRSTSVSRAYYCFFCFFGRVVLKVIDVLRVALPPPQDAARSRKAGRSTLTRCPSIHPHATKWAFRPARRRCRERAPYQPKEEKERGQARRKANGLPLLLGN
ncbi:hypothetical protein BKA81DRAFT_347251 [Phyllosticta paracitricarpa]